LNDWHWDWRIDGLVSKPAMNGCTGVICGAFIADNGRWPVQIDGNCSCSQHQVALRPCNIQLLPVHISADKSTPAKTDTKRVAAVVQAGGGVRMQHPPTLHPVIVRLAAHPAFSLAGREFVAQLPAHFLYRLATRVSVQRWEAVFRCRPSQAHAKQWHVIGIDIARQQRRALLCKAALFAVLVPRLLRFQGEYGVIYPLNLAQRIASRRHYLGSNKDEAEGVFEEGQRLYGEQRFSEAGERWGGWRSCSTRPRTGTCQICGLTADQAYPRTRSKGLSWLRLGRRWAARTAMEHSAAATFGAMVLPKITREGLRWEGRARRRATALGSWCLDCATGMIVAVLRRTMPKLCDSTVLRRHSGMYSLRSTWASCLRTAKVLRRT
jgi:hypothetical protein